MAKHAGAGVNHLYPYQEAGVDFLASRTRAYLADEMGLGKTVQAIVAAGEIMAQRPLVACPASVQENWKREWARWGGPGDLTVISYSKLIMAPKCFAPDADLLICDEAHYLKTPSAKRTKATLKLAQGVEYVWLLSGTPTPNDPRELWAPVKYLWPEVAERFGIKNAFEWMDRWCLWTASDYGYRVWGLKPAAKTELAPALREVMLRRRLAEVALDLPELRYTVEWLPADKELEHQLEGFAEDDDDPEHLSTLRRLLGSYKSLPVAERIVAELDAREYQSIVVMYHHTDTGSLLREWFEQRGYETTGFDGSTPPLDRQKAIDYFQGGYRRIFLAQQGAAGVGINLTKASEIVLVEPSWSPAENEQAIKRIHRIGQDAPCRARLFAVPDSLDAHLMTTLRRKQDMIRTVVDGG